MTIPSRRNEREPASARQDANKRIPKCYSHAPTLDALDHNFHELPCASGQEIDALGLGRPRDRWKKDILERQCHIAAGKSHRRQKPVVIDLPKAGRTILVLGKNAMVLQTKAAALLRALLNVRK